MKARELICVVCPNGCRLSATVNDDGSVEIGKIEGELCKKGLKWAKQEVVNPVRTISSNVVVEGGDFSLVSVRTDAPIPLKDIMIVMDVIKRKRLKAPVCVGDILIEKPAGVRCNIIATRNVAEKEKTSPAKGSSTNESHS